MRFFKKISKFMFDTMIVKSPEFMRKTRARFVARYLKTKPDKKKWRTWSIGRKCIIHSETEIGDYSGVGYRCVINRGVKIGNHVMMGPEVIIYTQNHRHDDTDIPMSKQGQTEVRPVIIEDDCWIGARVIILPGVTIGKGSIIGAGAVVPKSIPPYSVAVGNPCKVVKGREKD